MFVSKKNHALCLGLALFLAAVLSLHGEKCRFSSAEASHCAQSECGKPLSDEQDAMPSPFDGCGHVACHSPGMLVGASPFDHRIPDVKIGVLYVNCDTVPEAPVFGIEHPPQIS